MFRADRNFVTSNNKHGNGELIAISEPLYGAERNYDLEMSKECVWFETPAGDICSLL